MSACEEKGGGGEMNHEIGLRVIIHHRGHAPMPPNEEPTGV